MHRTPASLRIIGLLVAAAITTTSTGCSIIDRLFLLNADGPYAHGGHAGGGCRDCEAGPCQDCESGCPDGRCSTGDCANGVCKVPHAGRYGGLAKHHLSAEAYPYYTTRGPRDFLAKRPPSIGPQ
jgi:hypothetical protein